MRIIEAVTHRMMETMEGTIVNVESITALAPGSWPGVYSTSKAALHALSDSQRYLFLIILHLYFIITTWNQGSQ